jgi:glycosyltransferase involved in cell wall biosynthesis
MNNSKFDDKVRYKLNELLKVSFLAPYRGALTSSTRAHDYLRFLGVPKKRIFFGYNTLSIARIQRLSGAPPAPEGNSFEERVFLIVTRFVSEKNLIQSLVAYKLYRDLVAKPRSLHIVGYGALEGELRQHVDDMGLSNCVLFCGAMQTEGVAKKLAMSVALILFSCVEAFGNVVIEAQAMGLPVLISEVCGAWDNLVRTGVNGFVVEPNNAAGLAYFMSVLSEDRDLWEQMCRAALKSSQLGDVAEFARGVELLVE